MQFDLAQAPLDLKKLARMLRSQVCIVGGGIAGLTLARSLRASGISVTLLEAGGRAPDTSEARRVEDPFSAELSGRAHRGTHEGRVRALGGCSLTWGGQLLPLPADADWPMGPVAGQPSGTSPSGASQAAKLIAAQRLQAPSLLSAFSGLTARLSRFLPFSERNFAHTLGRKLRSDREVRIVLHAPVSAVSLTSSRDCVSNVLVRPPGGGSMQVEADQFVLASGTVETCRLLLASRSVISSGVGNDFGQVGLHFHDHLTLAAAEFEGAARARILRELRPWAFRQGLFRRALYSLKLEPGRELRAELGLHPAMAHITIEEPESSGVGAIRRLLRERQQAGTWISLARGMRVLPRAVLHGARLVWDALVLRRRYVSRRAKVSLQLNVAQDAPSPSRVSLSDNVDRLGMPLAVVDWRISAAELRTFRRFAGYLRDRLTAAGVTDGVRWQLALFAGGEAADETLLAEIDDARHAMGGACLGTDPRTSVVDPALRVHGIRNLSVASAAVFPDGSAQLPTETLLMLCERLAERLQGELG